VYSKHRIDLVQAVSQLVGSLSFAEKRHLFTQILSESKQVVPLSIFSGKLAGLEALVVFLKDEQKRSIAEISKLLGRNKSTLYSTYHQAKKKLIGKLPKHDYTISIPIDTFSNRKYSILESLVVFLKEHYHLSIKEIAEKTGKKYTTIHTTYSRYKKK